MGGIGSGSTYANGHFGAQPAPERKFTINRIQDYHREIMRLMVMGWTNKMIHQHTGISLATLCAIRNSPLTRRQLDVMQAARDATACTAGKVLEDTAAEAALKLKMLLDVEGDNRLVKDVAIAILDRAGHSPTQKIKGSLDVHVFKEGDLDELRNRFETAIQEGVPTDATYEEVGS